MPSELAVIFKENSQSTKVDLEGLFRRVVQLRSCDAFGDKNHVDHGKVHRELKMTLACVFILFVCRLSLFYPSVPDLFLIGALPR